MRHLMVAFGLLAVSGAAQANIVEGSPSGLVREQSGNAAGLAWKARSMMVGQTTTLFPNVVPGSPYAPSRPGKDGLVFLEFNTGFCSGSLMAGGRAVLTAAHCVADSTGAIAATGGFAYFYPGPADPFYDLGFGFTPGIERVDIGAIHVAPGYTGNVIDHNDLAIVFLDGSAPAFATEYLLAALSNPTGIGFNVAGFGNNGPDGTVGAFDGTFGRLREGDNIFDYALGDAAFGGLWAAVLGEPLSQISDSWVSDFDRVGFAANDTACTIAVALGAGAGFCNTGVGPREVGVAGGDSGGPQFVDGRIVSVTSYGLTFGAMFGDFDNFLNSSYGEFSGYAPVYRNRAWIEGLVPGAFGDTGVIPEPATWAMMLLGFGAVGFAVRRKERMARVSA